MTSLIRFATLSGVLSASLLAQQPGEFVQSFQVETAPAPGIRVDAPPGAIHDRVMIMSDGPKGGPGAATIDFIATEMVFDGTPVKNSPFSADAVNEFTQTLSDGNRITRKSTSSLYRDSEGRTRREAGLPPMAMLGGAVDQPSITMISDPVAGVTYMLNSKDKTARKLPMPGDGNSVFAYGTAEGRDEKKFNIGITGGKVAAMTSPSASSSAATNDPDTKTEDLGRQMIEGVPADGKRTTTTIPAGTIGNDRPIVIVHERWYSPDLKQVVLSKHNDPRMGETTYRLSRIQRTEPARSLFEVPSDYTVKEVEAPPLPKMRMKRFDGPAPEAEIQPMRRRI